MVMAAARKPHLKAGRFYAIVINGPKKGQIWPRVGTNVNASIESESPVYFCDLGKGLPTIEEMFGLKTIT